MNNGYDGQNYGDYGGAKSKEEKDEMMDKMMRQFFADMTAEDKQKMMAEMMPKMMEGVNMMEMMPRTMAQMMMGMMPKCLKIMLPKVPKEKRIDFVLEMVSTLEEQASAGLSEDEKRVLLQGLLKSESSR